MKKSFFLLALTFAILGISHSVDAQNRKTVTHVRAEARIINPMIIHQCSDLKFENVTGSSSGSTIAVASAAGNTATYKTTANPKTGGQTGFATAATFCVSGETGFSCMIAPRSANKVIVTGPTCGSCSNTLSVALADPSTGPSLTIPQGGTQFNDPAGSGTICYYVGGTLTVPAATNMEMGVYTGTWSETVAY